MSDSEVDIYGDLPEFNYDDNLHELQATIDELLARNDELFARMAQTKAEKEKTEENYNLLKKNMSSFILTAQKEVARKDKMISDLRKQLSELEKAKYNKSSRISSHERNGRQYSSSAEGERRKYGRRSNDLTRRMEPDENNIPDQRSNKEVISTVNKRNGYLSHSKTYNDDNRSLSLMENSLKINKYIPNVVKNNKNVQSHMTIFSERMRQRIEVEKEKEKEESKIEATPKITEKEASKVLNSKKMTPQVTKGKTTSKLRKTSEEKDANEILKLPKILNANDSLPATINNAPKNVAEAIVVPAKKMTKNDIKSRKASEEKDAKEILMLSKILTAKDSPQATVHNAPKKVVEAIVVPAKKMTKNDIKSRKASEEKDAKEILMLSKILTAKDSPQATVHNAPKKVAEAIVVPAKKMTKNDIKSRKASEEKDVKEISMLPKVLAANDSPQTTVHNALKKVAEAIVVPAKKITKNDIKSRKASEEKDAKEISMLPKILAANDSPQTTSVHNAPKKVAEVIPVPANNTTNLPVTATTSTTIPLKNIRSHTLRDKGTPSPFRITRKRSSAYTPISNNWNVKNEINQVPTPPAKKFKKDLSPSDLFGSDCSISDDDDDVPNIKLPATVYEDSCSAQIDNSRFGKTDAIINEEKRPFQTVNFEKPKSIFSPQKSNNAINSFSVKQNIKIIEDSFIGQFETTTQFVSALTKTEIQLSPLRCSKSNEDVSQILAKKAQSLFHQITGQDDKVNVLIPRKYPRVYSKVENKPNKTFSLKESFLFEQEEKVKNLNTENDKIIPVSPRKKITTRKESPITISSKNDMNEEIEHQQIDWVLIPLELEPRTTIRRRSLNIDGGKNSKNDTPNLLSNRQIENSHLNTINGTPNNEKFTQNLISKLESQTSYLNQKIEHAIQNCKISSANRKIEDSICNLNLRITSQPLRNRSSPSERVISAPNQPTDLTKVQNFTPIVKVIKKRRRATLVNVDDPGKFSVTRHRPINFSNTD